MNPITTMSSKSQYFISIGCVAAGLSCMTFGSCSAPVKTAQLSSSSNAKVIEAVRTEVSPGNEVVSVTPGR